MTSEDFAKALSEYAYNSISPSMVRHLSRFLNAEQRKEFLDFIGAEY